MPFDGRDFEFSSADVQVLLDARAGIEYAWIQGAMCDIDGGRCAVGWVYEAAEVVSKEDGLVVGKRVISDYLFRALPPSFQREPPCQPVTNVDLYRQTRVERYNDRKGRSHRRMIQLFDEAIKLAQMQQTVR